ncbi:sensor histidine kinase [Microbacterium invictum]|uniref:histidine kinase n=1 Tax=Microbacterium invictum TaxID=515415 RepID=A0ABZ0VC90_9MICO|nr:ATP-binding protein [Microbacterium invictum]WQB71247.1 ATP-binding protein [Microbacterium invictum]
MTTDPRAPRRRRPVMSVRARIILVITLVAGLGMVVVGAAVYLEERGRILRQVDDLLNANLEAARFLVEQGDADTATWASTENALAAVVQRAAPDDNTGVMGLVAGEPRLVPGVPMDVDLRDAAGFVAHVNDVTANGSPYIGTYAEDGVTWRFLATPIAVAVDGGAVAGDAEEAVFVIAYDLDAELAEIDAAARVWIIASTITLVVIGAVAALVTGRLLRPLRQMRETAERVSAQSLSERLPVSGRDDVSELARTMNDMLDRLDQALDSQRRLLSDVGHELKTPITIVRGYLEVVDPDSPTDVRETRDLAVDELERMSRLVQDLAATAALHGPAPVKPVPLDAADLMHQIARKAEGIAGATVETAGFAEVVAPLDAARVTQAVLQLAQNAVTHGGGRLVLSSRRLGDQLEISVRDFGPGVPDDEKSVVFDRFHRGAASAERAGSGLGLNIVQVIARAHGGRVRVEDAAGGGALFVMTLPTVDAGAARQIIPPRPPLPAWAGAASTAAPGSSGPGSSGAGASV